MGRAVRHASCNVHGMTRSTWLTLVGLWVIQAGCAGTQPPAVQPYAPAVCPNSAMAIQHVKVGLDPSGSDLRVQLAEVRNLGAPPSELGEAYPPAVPIACGEQPVY
jgi:hypothetical protein